MLAELKWDAQIQPNEIGVSVKDGVVTLTGWVDSFLKKWSAEDAAHRVAGVKAVANDIEVKLFSEHTDADIAEAAELRLQWDASGAGRQDSGDGFQRLGHAEGRRELELRETGRRTRSETSDRGKGVSNLITVKPTTTPSELKKRIEDALVRNAKLDANKITVDVQGGKAILKGAVRAWAEKEEAERVASLAPGVRTIRWKTGLRLRFQKLKRLRRRNTKGNQHANFA